MIVVNQFAMTLFDVSLREGLCCWLCNYSFLLREWLLHTLWSSVEKMFNITSFPLGFGPPQYYCSSWILMKSMSWINCSINLNQQAYLVDHALPHGLCLLLWKVTHCQSSKHTCIMDQTHVRSAAPNTQTFKGVCLKRSVISAAFGKISEPLKKERNAAQPTLSESFSWSWTSSFYIVCNAYIKMYPKLCASGSKGGLIVNVISHRVNTFSTQWAQQQATLAFSYKTKHQFKHHILCSAPLMQSICDHSANFICRLPCRPSSSRTML